MIPEGLYYSEEHEWVKVEGEIAAFGITDHAQHALGDIVFVELPGVGESFEKGDVSGSIESVKAVSDLYVPVSGEVTEINESLEDKPETVNEDPYGEGWIFKIKLSDTSELDDLMDAKAYEAFLSEQE
jgi:glycine cleavage system H protein